MPDVHVHLCALDSAPLRDVLPPLVSEAVRRNPGVAMLGAVLPDMVGLAPGWWRRVLQKMGWCSGWTDLRSLVHRRDAPTLFLALAQPRPSSLLGPLRRLALAAGFASHVVLDRHLDPQVHRLVEEDGPLHGAAHRRRWLQLELEQAAVLEQLGCLSLRPASELLEHSPVVRAAQERRVLHHINDAMQVVVGQRPRPRDWQIWSKGLHRHLHFLAAHPVPADDGFYAGDRGPRWSTVKAQFDQALISIEETMAPLARAFEPGDLLPSALLDLSRQGLLSQRVSAN